MAFLRLPYPILSHENSTAFSVQILAFTLSVATTSFHGWNSGELGSCSSWHQEITFILAEALSFNGWNYGDLAPSWHIQDTQYSRSIYLTCAVRAEVTPHYHLKQLAHCTTWSNNKCRVLEYNTQPW